MCLAQGHNAVTLVRLEPVAPRSLVKHSTTELPKVLLLVLKLFLIVDQAVRNFAYSYNPHEVAPTSLDISLKC